MADKRPKNTLTVSEVNQDFARAQRAVSKGPLIITTRGEPSLVLMSYNTYVHSARKKSNLIERLHVPNLDEVDFEAPRLEGAVKPAQFD